MRPADDEPVAPAARPSRAPRVACAVGAALAINGAIAGALGLLNAPPTFDAADTRNLRIAVYDPPPQPEPPVERIEPPEPVEAQPITEPEPLERPEAVLEAVALAQAPLDLPSFDIAPPRVTVAAPTPAPRRASRSAADGPVDANGADQPGRAVARPEPEYPRVALRRGQTGYVVARVLADARGRVQQVQIQDTTGHSAFASAVERTLRDRWRYSPTYHRGAAVPAWHEVTIHFQLEDS